MLPLFLCYDIHSCLPLANVSVTVRDINNMGDSPKEGAVAADADSYFTNKNGYKIFCKYWHPELKDGEKPRYSRQRRFHNV